MSKPKKHSEHKGIGGNLLDAAQVGYGIDPTSLALAGGVAGTLLLAAGVHRVMRRHIQQVESEVLDSILEDVAKWTAKQSGEDYGSVLDRLQVLRSPTGSSSEIEGVSRIEVNWTKTSADTVDREVVVARVTGGAQVVIGRISRDIKWHDTPREIRSCFIKDPEGPVIYVLLGGEEFERSIASEQTREDS